MTKPRVFVTRRMPGDALDRLAVEADVDLWPDEMPPAYAELVRRAAAAEALRRGLDLGEDSPEAKALLGILHQREGRLDQARALFESIVKSGTEMPLAFLNLGLVLFAQGEYEQAAEQLASVLVLDEKEAAAHFHLGLLYMDYLGNPEQARAHLTRYLELGGRDARVQGWLDRLP